MEKTYPIIEFLGEWIVPVVVIIVIVNIFLGISDLRNDDD